MELLIRKYLYIDPNGLDYWKKLAKMIGENCKVCGKPLVPNKYADEFEKKLLKAITKTLQQQREDDIKNICKGVDKIISDNVVPEICSINYPRIILMLDKYLQSLKQENK